MKNVDFENTGTMQSPQVCDRNTPQKALQNQGGYWFCPSCKKLLWQHPEETKFCYRCGQAVKFPQKPSITSNKA